MRAIKSKDTKEEILLSKALWKKGHRYRKNNKKVFGTPDLTFKKNKIAIFVDGEFFHGFNWEEKQHQINSNREFWISKIERNIERDKIVNKFLIENGWKVIRFWITFVKKNLQDCVLIIEKEIENSKK
ncbi:very short patch repair endonuclease [Flavobacterium sp. SLB02]|uniref:very short patch repair endonuclease n=1 Tax=Flavobacterium sp. SLB02 TaxID=2665645 RepID=UPI0012A98DDB|nr:very short patch repair endonuclease [Flavobacterium sp. SLB02]QGK73421.1 DNA mismatch endonuclease Vsr [Flavobacterium sp. SLB02]